MPIAHLRQNKPFPLLYLGHAQIIINAPYCQGNFTVFGENSGQQCVALSLCALIYSKITKITSVDDMTQIMIVGIQLYSSLSLLSRQSMSMLTGLPGMVTVFEQFSTLNTVTVILVTSITTVYATHRVQHLKHSRALNYNSFILTEAIIGVGIYSIEAGGYSVFDSHARDMYHNSHNEGTCIVGNTIHA